MAAPAFTRGKGASLFGGRKEEAPKEESSEGAKTHLDALEGIVSTPRARAALNTLRAELVGDGDTSSKRKSSDSDAKKAAMERFK